MNNEQKFAVWTIAEHYGKAHQTNQAMQELGELIVALTRGDKEGILDEIADVLIMIEQLKRLYDIRDSTLERHISVKVRRQIKRMGESK